MKNNGSSRVLAMMGLMLAAALLVSYIESLIPMPTAIYGFKLGLVNGVILLVLYEWGAKEAVLISFLRILLMGFLFGNLMSIVYSLAGGMCSLLVMTLLKQTKQFTVLGVSAAGGVMHNLGQLFVAAWILRLNRGAILFYVPLLMAAGLLTGVIVGLFTERLIPYLEPVFQKYGAGTLKKRKRTL